MIYEEFKPFLLAACFPCDQHHKTIFLKFFKIKVSKFQFLRNSLRALPVRSLYALLKQVSLKKLT